VIAAAALALALAANTNANAAGSTASPAFITLQRYEAAHARAIEELGAGVAADFDRRLFDDLYRQSTDVPDGYSAADWSETVERIRQLDAEAVDQIVAGVPAPLRAQPGLHAYFVPSRADRTWQAVAVYVPAALAADSHAPLVVALHGNPQTEAELLGQPYLRRLADRTGTIVVAPYGRGIYDFAEPAESDLYDLLELVQNALPVDRRRTYLAGYSMGGFSVFKVGPRGGYKWRAAMCISGALLNSGTRAVATAWHDLPVYVVTGARDESIPTVYGEQTARFLADLGLPVSFYEEQNGSHLLRTLVPSLESAWLDMHAGAERPYSVPHGRGGALPRSAPPPISKN
jgi:predicted esterase